MTLVKVLPALLLFSLWAVPAEAYLDPGTGSFVFQMLVAAVVSVGFVLKSYWHRIVALVTRRGRGDGPPP